jgi:hypothetical protein
MYKRLNMKIYFRSILLLSLLNFMCLSVFAQKLEVESFEILDQDVRARVKPQYDINEKACALIIVRTNIDDLRFSPNNGVCSPIRYTNGEYWVYVSEEEQRISFWNEKYVRSDYNIPYSLESNKVYQMVITAPLQEESSNLRNLTFLFNTSDVYISKGGGTFIKSTGNSANFLLPIGKHEFVFSKESFKDEVLTVDLDHDKITNVNLTTGQSTIYNKTPGIVYVGSTVKNVKVYLNDLYVGPAPYQDVLQEGKYKLTLKADHYYTYNQEISVQPGKSVNLGEIELSPKFGYINITSEPSGADVIWKNRVVGQTPMLNRDIYSGAHEIKVVHPLFIPETFQFVIEDGDVYDQHIKLTPNYGTLNLVANQEGASVYIDDEYAGLTPLEKNMPEGSYRVKIGFGDRILVNEEIAVRIGERTERYFTLDISLSKLKVVAKGANIFLDGKLFARDSVVTYCEPGSHQIIARAKNCIPEERNIEIESSKNYEFEIEMKKVHGSISVMTASKETQESNVYLNEVLVGQTPGVFPVFEGRNTLLVKKKGYEEYVTMFEIKKDENLEFNVELRTPEMVFIDDIDKYNNRRNIYAGFSLLSFSAAGIIKSIADNHYDEYLVATYNAEEIRLQVEREDIMWQSAAYIGVGLLVPTVYNHFMKRSTKRKYKAFTRQNGEVGVAIRF